VASRSSITADTDPLPALPARIGRFEVLSRLGAGAQGAVYLAFDPQLERQVAVKTLTGPGLADPRVQDALMQEARIVGRFKHANIVPVFDAGSYGEGVYLVFEYVEGQTLAALLREGPLAPERAVAIIDDLVAAVAAAHAERILHRDIKPANVLIGPDGRARITDFGIAMPESAVSEENRMWGSLAYLAPEQVAGGAPTARSDVFALGAVCYEILSGQRAFSGDSQEAVLYQVAHKTLVPPSALNEKTDPALDAPVLRALSKDPAERYADAPAFHQALGAVRDLDLERRGSSGALEFLLRRIKRKPDFPGMSRVIQEITALSSRQNERPVSALANAVLKDYAITQKLLRLANSSYYGQFSGTIRTISRAVVVLGFQQVNAAALSLVLFENLKGASEADKLMGRLVESLFSGMLARTLAGGGKQVEPEHAFICSLFHTLGELLVLYYFPEEAQDIAVTAERRHISPQAAAVQVLGVGYEQLARAVLKEWNFPAEMLATVSRPGAEPLGKADTPAKALHQITLMSNELAQVLGEQEGEDLDKALEGAYARYGDALGLSQKDFGGLVGAAREKLNSYLSVVRLPPAARSRLVKLERAIVGAQADERTVATLIETPASEEAAPGRAPPPASPQAQVDLLTEGMSDLAEMLLGDFDLNEFLQTTIETVHRGLQLRRSVLFLRDPRRSVLVARYALGGEVEQLVGQLELPFDGRQDLVKVAFAAGKDVAVEDSADARISRHIPRALMARLAPTTFLLLPLSARQRALGLLYLEPEGAVQFDERVLKALRAVRGQAAIGFQQAEMLARPGL
jgi:serine/threonine protein kinase